MPTIEERVVEMRFDNSNFEKNVSQSVSTLDKLKAALHFDKSAKSLENLQNAGNHFNMNPVTTAIQSVTNKLSAMEVIGVAALTRLTNQGMAMMERFVKSVSIDQVSAGFTKYGQKTTAVQTIMAATAKDFKDQGEQMEYVNEQLTKLNWFTDETSYSFLDMVSNIGKFTSNGIKLDSAVTSMQGISTWAAISGANVNEASRAMYNLAQAISTGSVKLIDWKSIENANMATTEFKETVIQTALEMGTLEKRGEEIFVKDTKDAMVSVTNFNAELSKGWFTSEVLQKALKNYGDFTNKLYEFSDATGLTASRIIEMVDEYKTGNLNMAKASQETGMSVETLTKQLNVLGSEQMELGRKAFKAAQEAKTFEEAIGSVKDAVSTGWMQSFEHIFGNYTEAKKIWTSLANELWEVFAGGGERRNSILSMWHSGVLEVAEDGTVLKKMASGYDMLYEAIGNLWTGVKNILGPIGDAWDIVFGISESDRAAQLITLTTKFRDFSIKVASFMENLYNPLDKAKVAIEDVASVAQTGVAAVTKPVKDLAKAAEDVLDPISKTTPVLEQLAAAVNRGDYGNGQKRVKMLRELGYSYEMVQNRVNELRNCSFRYKLLDEDIAAHEAKKIEQLQEVTEETVELTEAQEKANTRYWNMVRIFHGVFAAVDIVRKVFSEFTKTIRDVAGHLFNKLLPVFDVIVEKLANLGDKVAAFRDTLSGENKISKFFEDTTKSVNHFIDVFGEFISKVWNKLSNSTIVKSFTESIIKLKDVIVQLVTEGIDSAKKAFASIDTEKLSQIVAGVVEWFLDKGTKAINFLADHLPDVKNFLGIFTKGAADSIKSVGDALANLWKGADGYVGTSMESAGNFFTALMDFCTTQFTDENSTFNQIKQNVNGTIADIMDLFTDMTPQKVEGAIKKGLMATVIAAIAKFFFDVGEGVKSLADVPKTMVDVLNNVAGALIAYQNNIKAGAIMTVAKAILYFTAAIVILSFVPEDRLNAATASLMGIMTMLALVMAVYAKIIGYKSKLKVSSMIKPLNEFFNSLSESFKKFTHAAAIGVIAFGIGVLLAAFLFLAKSLAGIPEDDLRRAENMVLTFLFVIGIFLVAVSRLSKEGNNLSGVGTAIIGLALAMVGIAAAAYILGQIEPDRLGNAVLAIIGIILALGAFSAIGKGTAMIKLAAGLVIVAVALALMVPSLIALAMLPDISKLGGVLAGLAGVLLVLGAVSAGMSFITEATGTSVAANLMTMAIAFAALMAVIVMAGTYADEASEGLKILAYAFGGLLAAVMLTELLSEPLETFTTALLEIGVAALLFGAGAALIGAGFWLIANSIDDLFVSIANIGKTFKERQDELITGFMIIITAVLLAIVACKSGLVKALYTLISSGLEAFEKVTPLALAKLFAFLVTLLTFINSVTPELVNMLYGIFMNLLLSFVDIINTKASHILRAVGLVVKALVKLVAEAFRQSLGWLFDLIGLGELNKTIDNWLEEQEEDISDSTDKLRKQVEKDVGSTDTDAMFAKTMEGNQSETAAMNKADSTSAAYWTELKTKLQNGEITPEEMAQLMVDNPTAGVPEDAADKGEEIATAGTNAATETVKNAQGDVANAIVSTINGASATAKEQASDSAETVGENYDKGVARGINKHIGIVTAACMSMATQMTRATNNTLEVKSPSKVGARIGMFFDMGIGRGVTKNAARFVVSPTEDMATNMIDTLKAALTGVNDLVTDDTMFPTISPVLDLTNVQNGAGRMHDLFAGSTASMAVNAKATFKTDGEIMSEKIQEAFDASLDEIKTKLNDIQDNSSYRFEAPVVLDGREIARASAEYTRTELNRIDRMNNRKGGKL